MEAVIVNLARNAFTHLRDELQRLGTENRSAVVAGNLHSMFNQPPCFLYAVDLTVVAPKLPGIQWLHAGTDWTFYDVVRVGDAYDVYAKLVDVQVKAGKFADKWVGSRFCASSITTMKRFPARASCTRQRLNCSCIRTKS